MSITNNSFSKDDPGLRDLRLTLLENSINDYAVELDVTGDLLVWAQNCGDGWDDAQKEARRAENAKGLAFEEFKHKQIDCKKRYQKTKNFLKAIIAPHDNAAEIMRAYSIDGKTPLSREGLECAVDDLARQHETYKAAGDPWILPDHMVDALRTLRAEMSDLHTTACTMRERAKVAREAMKARFRDDTHRLKMVYELSVMAWGVQGGHFLRLGMLRKSMIWTKKRPPSPENFRYDSNARTFQWDLIDGADSYEAHYRESDKSGHWTAFYEGEANSCPQPEGLLGAFDFRVRAIAKGKEGHWSGSIEEVIQN